METYEWENATLGWNHIRMVLYSLGYSQVLTQLGHVLPWWSRQTSPPPACDLVLKSAQFHSAIRHRLGGRGRGPQAVHWHPSIIVYTPHTDLLTSIFNHELKLSGVVTLPVEQIPPKCCCKNTVIWQDSLKIRKHFYILESLIKWPV